MDINEILKMYNEDHRTLVDIAKELNSSKSTLSRVLRDSGYVFDKALKQYIHQTENTLKSETGNTVNNKTENNVSRETSSSNSVKCTFELSSTLYRALKVKCALEGVKMVDFVRETLESNIEKKYFDM